MKFRFKPEDFDFVSRYTNRETAEECAFKANALLEAEEKKSQRIYWLQENTPAGILAYGHKSDRSTRHTHTALLWNVEELK